MKKVLLFSWVFFFCLGAYKKTISMILSDLTLSSRFAEKKNQEPTSSDFSRWKILLKVQSVRNKRHLICKVKHIDQSAIFIQIRRVPGLAFSKFLPTGSRWTPPPKKKNAITFFLFGASFDTFWHDKYF